MDRLQIAIQKARAQRANKVQGSTPAPVQTPHATEPAANLPPGSLLREQAASAAAVSGDFWSQLNPIDLSAKHLRNNRLIATTSGRDSAPYDLLRTRMLHQARANGWKRVGMVSPTAACGKTTAVANLTFALSRQADIRALVLDLDLRRPRLAAMLGQQVATNMEDVLTGSIDFANHALRIGDNVAIGLNSGPARSPSELLQSRDVRSRLDHIEAQAAPDITLVDLPPMMATDDNFGFLGNVDAVLVMVAAEETGMSQIEVTIRQLEELTQVMGIVLNKCRYTQGAYGYDGKYY